MKLTKLVLKEGILGQLCTKRKESGRSQRNVSTVIRGSADIERGRHRGQRATTGGTW